MDLRLFPLNTVLFPGMKLPLHIFEERYKLMIRECLEEDAPFGVVLIKSGEEVGEGAAVPHDVGTTARILQVEYLDDGRMNIFTHGERRFRIVAVNTTQPYMRGEVQLLETEPATDSAHAAMPRARQMFDDYLKTYFSIADQWVREVYVPDDPGDAGDYIAARCDVPPETKQQWLEELNPEARLRAELDIISEALPDMHGRLVAHLRQKTTGFGVLN
jgi:Lon protease-like protein